jgi:SAM-dependent methyltransferase
VPYQDFDGRGDSKSYDKLRALRLDDLAVLTDRDPALPLKGLAVLDLGCNEGFFCVEAVRQGATRVVGIDTNAAFIEAARKRCPEATFVNTTWWNIPDEKFDVVFFLSTMHYEANPKGLFDKIARHLTPNGRLILECGIFTDGAPGDLRAWRTVMRGDGLKRYPTSDLLIRDLLSAYAVRSIGPSVPQVGDPVLRFVYHCGARVPVALIVAAKAGTGKTALSLDLDSHGIPTYATDLLLWRLARDPRHQWRPLAELITSRFPSDGRAFDNSIGDIAALIAETGREAELAEIIVDECPRDAGLFCIQGDALRHDKLLAQVVARLEAVNVRPWIVRPL